jgi:hypothetical protein
MNGFLARACGAAAAGGALCMLAVTAASASGSGGAVIHHGALGPAGNVPSRGVALRPTGEDPAIGRVIAAAARSRTFAGYQTAVTAGSATSSAATFTVPALSCTTADRGIAADAGVAANKFKTASVAGVFLGCAKGKAVYFPWLLANGAESNYTTTHFSAGDVINLSASVTTSGITVQVTDVTKSVSVTNTITGAGASADAAWIGDDGWGSSTGALLGVPGFGKLAFTNCLIDGTALGGWHPQAYQRVNSHGTVQIATGGPWPGGTAFTTHYQHS